MLACLTPKPSDVREVHVRRDLLPLHKTFAHLCFANVRVLLRNIIRLCEIQCMLRRTYATLWCTQNVFVYSPSQRLTSLELPSESIAKQRNDYRNVTRRGPRCLLGVEGDVRNAS